MRPQLNPLILGPGAPWSLPGSSLDIQFTTGRAAVNRQKSAISSLLTTTRASTGYAVTSTGSLTLFPANTPRITDLGLLVEQASTNYLLQSQTFDNATWVKSSATVTADAVVAPDGTTTADKLIASAGFNQHYVLQTVNGLTASEGRVVTVYAKYAGVQYLVMYMSQGGIQAWFDLQGGTVSNVTGSASITALGNGWYRCLIYNSSATGTGDTYELHTASVAGNFNFTGDGVNGIYLWGAQLERPTSFATSYIPTTTVSVTRAADSIKASGLSIVAPYSVLLSVGPLPTTSGDLVNWGSLANGGGLYAGTGSGLCWVRESSVTTANVASSGSFLVNTDFKLAARFATNDVNTALKGGIGTHDTSSIPPTITTLGFGTAQVSFSGTMPNGTIKRLTIFSAGLADAQLQALTT